MKNISDSEFLTADYKMKDAFFVIDNTDYPEALSDPSWKGFVQPKDGSMDIVMSVSVNTIFESNRKFQVYVRGFSVILLCLAILLISALTFYCYQTFKYNRYVRERKKLKFQLMKVKDSEYTSFLLEQNQILKEKQKHNGKRVAGGDSSKVSVMPETPRAINDSIVATEVDISREDSD